MVTSIYYNDAKEVSYRYNATGDLIAMEDWLGETAFEIDLLHQLTVATEHKGNQVEYAYDGMVRVTEMRYPNGWVEYYTYDKMGRLLSVDDTHPSEKPAKTQKHTYDYDANGNLILETYYKNRKAETAGEYTFDETNKKVEGIKANREQSIYSYGT